MSLATLTGIPGTLRLPVISYSTTLGVSLQNAHLRMGNTVVPVKVSQGNLNLLVQFKSEAKYVEYKDFVRKHHQSALRDKQPQLRFTYPSQGIDFLGYILKSPAGVRVAEWAPQAQIQMLLTRDLVNTTTNSFSQVESFDQFYQQDINVNDLVWNLPDDPGSVTDPMGSNFGVGGGQGVTGVVG